MNENGEQEDKQVKRPMIYFERENLIMPIWGILTIEKDFGFSNKSAFYSIVINKGLEPSERCPIGEKTFIFGVEKARDDKFNAIKNAMEEWCDFKVL